jgi:hypothetical protein
MKARYITPSLLLAGLIALSSPVATASDEFAGALFGAGAGAVLGHAMGGHDGAIVGGFLGAVVGASAADDDYRYGTYYRPQPYVVYRPAPVHYYAPPPYWSNTRYAYPHWRNQRDGWRNDRNGWRNGDRDGWRDGNRDRDRDGWRGDRRSEGPRHSRDR